MSTKKTIQIVLIASVVMLALVFGPRASNPTSAQSQTQAGVTVPYSGSLTDAAGQPVAVGAYELSFTLYQFESGGDALWAETQKVMTLQGGGFTVLLGGVNPLPKAVLEDGAAWLDVGVRGPGEASFTLLSPRQKVSMAAPEAPTASSCAHDHWGETWSGGGWGLILQTNNSYDGYTLRAESAVGNGIYGKASTDGYGVYGESTSGNGVYGQSTNYFGVYGKSLSTGGSFQSIGVMGETAITTGDTAGVWGQVAASGTYARGVVGWATKATGVNYGVWGQSESIFGTGVYGQALAGGCTTNNCRGVYGITTNGRGVYGETTTGFGVYGLSSSGAAVYADAGNGSAIGLQILGNSSGDLITASTFFPSDLRFRVTAAGNVTADSGFTTPAADLAEMLPAVKGLEPGDVLVIGEDGLLTRCTTAYQPTVVGVYSTKPGFLGGGGDDVNLTGKIPLAVIGVVPVKVSAENGPILPGDLLVASSTPGYAMKAGANPPIGTVIGKALASLLDGTGVIQILVMLQ